MPNPDQDAARVRARRAALAGAAVVLAATALVAAFGLRIHRLVLFDEKYTIEGARWFAEDLERVFGLLTLADRGVERLAPLLLLPFAEALSASADLFVAGHIVFAALHGITGLAAYLIARDLGAPALWPAAAAALATLGPWALFGATFLNNAPAAAFAGLGLWAVLRTLLRPSTSMDALALACLGLSTLARVSHAVLFAAYAAAVVVQAWRDRPAGEERLRAAALILPRAARAHPLPAAIAVAGAIGLALTNASLVGSYPSGVDFSLGRWLERVERGLAVTAAGTMIVPAAVGLAWILAEGLRPSRREAGAFATIALTGALALAVVNLAGGIDERYELPLAVPFAVAFAVAAGRREVRPAALAAAGALTLVAIHRQALVGVIDPRVDYLAMPSREWFSLLPVGRTASALGTSPAVSRDLLALVGVAGAAALVVSWRRLPRAAPLAAAAFALHGAVAAAWAMGKVSGYSRPELGFADLSFVERATGGAEAHPLAHPGEPDANVPILWNELQYFNAPIRRPVSLGEPSYTLCCIGISPLVLAVDDSTGAVHSPEPLPTHILTTPRWLPRGLGGEIVARSGQLELPVRVERLGPDVRLAWSSAGFSPGGSVAPGGRGVLRVFPAARRPRASCLRLTVHAPVGTARRTRWRVGPAAGTLAPGTSKRVEVRLPGGPAVRLSVTGSANGAGWLASEPASVSLSDLRLVDCGAPES